MWFLHCASNSGTVTCLCLWVRSSKLSSKNNWTFVGKYHFKQHDSCCHSRLCCNFFILVSHITSTFSNVMSPLLQINYYFRYCHVILGKLHGSVDRWKTVLSQVYSDYSVTLISSHAHVRNVRSQKHAVHLFLLLPGLLLTATYFHICPFTAAPRLDLFICRMLLFKVPDKWGIKLSRLVLHNYILYGSLVIWILNLPFNISEHY